MGTTFTHKFLLIIFASFTTAGMLHFYRHVVQRAIYETSDAGWREMDLQRAKEKAAQHH